MLSSPMILPYAGTEPRFGSPPRAGIRSAVLGRATIGRDAVLGPESLIRADGHYVEIGDGFFLGERGTVHIAHELYPTIIGDRVSVGRSAVVHACTVGSDCVFEEGVVILDGSTIADRVVIEAGSTVFPRSTLEGGQVYTGSPAKPVRPLEPGEIAERARRLRENVGTGSSSGADGTLPADLDPSVFIAATARVRGTVRMGANASLWFSCDLDAEDAAIEVGENSNIQDNTVIRCTNGPVVMGRDAVIGHNVHVSSCTIADRSLLGIGSRVAEGTVVEEDVLLAAGAYTEPGQVLEKGWLWAGRPARARSRMDDAKITMIAWTIDSYRGYAQNFLQAQRAWLSGSGRAGSG